MLKTVTIPKKNYKRKIQTYVAMTVFLLAIAGVYGFFQFRELMAVKSALASGQQELADLQNNEKQIAADYASLKESYNEDYRSIRESINAVLPIEESYTELTKQLDDFMYENNSTQNPIFMSDLKFSKPRTDIEADYAILPFSLTLSTTRDNFEKFIKHVENSGSLEDGTRLMDITSISINFPVNQDELSSGTPSMSVSISMNAYFQKPATVTATKKK